MRRIVEIAAFRALVGARAGVEVGAPGMDDDIIAARNEAVAAMVDPVMLRNDIAMMFGLDRLRIGRQRCAHQERDRRDGKSSKLHGHELVLRVGRLPDVERPRGNTSCIAGFT